MDWIKAEIICGSDRRICDRIKDIFLRLCVYLTSAMGGGGPQKADKRNKIS